MEYQDVTEYNKEYDRRMRIVYVTAGRIVGSLNVIFPLEGPPNSAETVAAAQISLQKARIDYEKAVKALHQLGEQDGST